MQAGNIRNVDVVYNGIDHNQYRPAASEAERQLVRSRFKLRPGVHYMVCVATPVALKGWIELLHAIKDIGTGFEGWQLLMVAPRRLHHDAIDLHKVSEELGIAREVHYVGELSPADLAVLFRGCDAFILPSYNEGMANALLEAMASGLPCITTEVGGHNEVIANGVDGLLVPPRNVPALVAAIGVITRDADLRQQMGVNARARMIAFGDYLQNAGKLLQLLSNHK
jgi:glycosyltransferase involved in cell wall biosynthesis